MKSDKFESLVDRHKDAVYRHMIRVCRNRDDAEDALASALMVAFQSADHLKSDDSFAAWLTTIGRRVCSKMRAHPGMAEVFKLAETMGFGRQEDEAFDLQILKGCVKDAVHDLTDIYRQAYELCDIEGHTDEEAAQISGVTTAALKGRLRRAREMVRERLDRSVCGT